MTTPSASISATDKPTDKQIVTLLRREAKRAYKDASMGREYTNLYGNGHDADPAYEALQSILDYAAKPRLVPPMLRDIDIEDGPVLVRLGTVAHYPVVIVDGQIVAAEDPEHGEIWRWLREDDDGAT